MAEVGRPLPTEEKHAVYERYLGARHDGAMSGSWEEFRDFLHRAPEMTREVVFRAARAARRGGHLRRRAATRSRPSTSTSTPSSPRARPARSTCCGSSRRRGGARCPWLYLGYYVAGSPRMAYKAGFHPHEILGDDGRFRPGPRGVAVE